MATILIAKYIEARIAISWRSTFGITTLKVGIWKLRIIRGRLPRRCILSPYLLVRLQDATPRNDSHNGCSLKHNSGNYSNKFHIYYSVSWV